MVKNIEYKQLTAHCEDICKDFESLMYDYIDEMNTHSHRPLPKEFQLKWISSIIAEQGTDDCHLELCYLDDHPIGFLYGKVDHENHTRSGFGYIMEFYIKPELRRSGYGRAMFQRLEQLFSDDGVKMMYLTADPVTGKPFWEAIGFVNTMEKLPLNQLDIYEKPVSPET